MIDQSNPDFANSATDVALLERPTGGGSPSQQGGKARERIHRFAGMVHRAIDNVEQSLNATGQGATATQSKYGEQARQYGDSLRGQINARPLQSAGIALGAGVVLDKLFSRTPRQVRVVKVPVPVARPAWETDRFAQRRGRGWMEATGAHLQGLAGAGQQVVGKVGAAAGTAAGMGIAGTRAMASTVADTASTLPLQMRLATERLLARSQEYGSMARTAVQEHPLAGAGALLGVAALLATPLLRRRSQVAGTAYVSVDDRGNGLAWQRDRFDSPYDSRGMIASRPVTSAVVVLGLGALAAAMLKRR